MKRLRISTYEAGGFLNFLLLDARPGSPETSARPVPEGGVIFVFNVLHHIIRGLAPKHC